MKRPNRIMKQLWFRYLIYFIVCVAIMVFMRNPLIEKYITIDVNTVSAIMSLFLSALLIHVTYLIGKHQNSLQKANIKLALYDKRYKIYEVIVRTKHLSDTADMVKWNLQRKGEESYIISQMSEIHDELYNASVVAHTVFPKEIALKVEEAYKLFNMTILEHLHAVKKLEEIAPDDFDKLMKLSRELKDISKQNLDTVDREHAFALLSKFVTMTNYTPSQYKKRKEYMNWLSESKILEDIQPYITIDKLDE